MPKCFKCNGDVAIPECLQDPYGTRPAIYVCSVCAEVALKELRGMSASSKLALAIADAADGLLRRD